MVTLRSVFFFLIVTSLSLSASYAAKWQLDNDNSSLHFISIKKGDIAEVHRFKTLSGTIKEGKASLAIDLASVDTKIPIRDERMNNELFKTKQFSTATASIDLGKDAKPTGKTAIKVTLDLHGVKKDVAAEVMVSSTDDQVTVSTLAPIVINAADFGLDKGVEKLRELAQLDSISKAVPVTFHLVFTPEKAK